MSAGLGSVPAQQTYLDIGQGNRVFDSLYDSELPALAPGLRRLVDAVATGGIGAAEIVPALLAGIWSAGGVVVFAALGSSCAFGASRELERGCDRHRRHAGCGLVVDALSVRRIPATATTC